MRRTVIGLAAAASLVLAACGGDDGDSSSDDETAETTETTEAAAGDASAGDGGSGSPSSPEAERFCEEFSELTQEGVGATADPGALIDSMRAIEPPPEIADDFALTLEGAEIQEQMTQGGEQPDPDLMAQFQERSQEFNEANGRVQEFISTECGLGGAPPPEAESDSESDSESEG